MSYLFKDPVMTTVDYSKISVSKWRDPLESVHPARGGPSNTSSGTSSQPYLPTYKYVLEPPEPTDDEASDDDFDDVDDEDYEYDSPDDSSHANSKAATVEDDTDAQSSEHEELGTDPLVEEILARLDVDEGKPGVTDKSGETTSISEQSTAEDLVEEMSQSDSAGSGLEEEAKVQIKTIRAPNAGSNSLSDISQDVRTDVVQPVEDAITHEVDTDASTESPPVTETSGPEHTSSESAILRQEAVSSIRTHSQSESLDGDRQQADETLLERLTEDVGSRPQPGPEISVAPGSEHAPELIIEPSVEGESAVAESVACLPDVLQIDVLEKGITPVEPPAPVTSPPPGDESPEERDKKVSFAPGTPEPKLTTRKKRSTSGSKKTKKRRTATVLQNDSTNDTSATSQEDTAEEALSTLDLAAILNESPKHTEAQHEYTDVTSEQTPEANDNLPSAPESLSSLSDASIQAILAGIIAGDHPEIVVPDIATSDDDLRAVPDDPVEALQADEVDTSKQSKSPGQPDVQPDRVLEEIPNEATASSAAIEVSADIGKSTGNENEADASVRPLDEAGVDSAETIDAVGGDGVAAVETAVEDPLAGGSNENHEADDVTSAPNKRQENSTVANDLTGTAAGVSDHSSEQDAASKSDEPTVEGRAGNDKHEAQEISHFDQTDDKSVEDTDVDSKSGDLVKVELPIADDKVASETASDAKDILQEESKDVDIALTDDQPPSHVVTGDVKEAVKQPAAEVPAVQDSHGPPEEVSEQGAEVQTEIAAAELHDAEEEEQDRTDTSKCSESTGDKLEPPIISDPRLVPDKTQPQGTDGAVDHPQNMEELMTNEVIIQAGVGLAPTAQDATSLSAETLEQQGIPQALVDAGESARETTLEPNELADSHKQDDENSTDVSAMKVDSRDFALPGDVVEVPYESDEAKPKGEESSTPADAVVEDILKNMLAGGLGIDLVEDTAITEPEPQDGPQADEPDTPADLINLNLQEALDEAEALSRSPPSPTLSKGSSKGWTRPSRNSTTSDARPPEKASSSTKSSRYLKHDPRVRERRHKSRRDSSSLEDEAERRRKREARKAEEAARFREEEEEKRIMEDELRQIRREATAKERRRLAEKEGEAIARKEAEDRRRRREKPYPDRKAERRKEALQADKDAKTPRPPLVKAFTVTGESVTRAGLFVRTGSDGGKGRDQYSKKPSTRDMPYDRQASPEARRTKNARPGDQAVGSDAGSRHSNRDREVMKERLPPEISVDAPSSSTGEGRSHRRHRDREAGESRSERPHRSRRDSERRMRSTVAEEQPRSFIGSLFRAFR